MTPVERPTRTAVICLAVGFCCFGILVGLILCDWVHAAETSGGTGRFEPVEEQGEAQGFFPIPAREWVQITPNVFPADRVIYGDTPLTCLATMETAMRAMDEFIYREPPLTTTAIFDECVNSAVCMAQRELARVQRREAAVTQWELGKACWRKP